MGEVMTEVRSGRGCCTDDVAEELDELDELDVCTRAACSWASSSAASVLMRSMFIDAKRVCFPPLSAALMMVPSAQLSPR